MGLFDKKHFNEEVFTGYMQRIPNPKKNELIKCKAIRARTDLKESMADQIGGNYITTILKGLIGSAAPQNYDGQTDMEASSTHTYKHSRVVVGRMNAFTEKDFTEEITGGHADAMENVAEQLTEYWDEIDQATLIAILTGVFSMVGGANGEFVAAHTHNITAVENSEGDLGKMDATSLNTCMQRACGDNKSKFSLALMHSVVSTNLENYKLLKYLKYTDAQGMEREVGLGTLNGKLVIIDDSMPVKDVPASDAVEAVEEVKGVYTLNISAAAVADDKIVVKFGDTEVTYVADGAATAANVAKTLRTLIGAVSGFTDVFTVGGTGSTVTFTQKVGGTGVAPTATVTQANSGTLAGTVTTTTPGVAAVAAKAAVTAHKEYTTYVLGDGAIEYTDCGAKVPNEVDRDPKTNGGQDTLYSRQRKCFAPYGISFTMASMASLSPTDAELAMGENWELVSADLGDGEKEYIAHKTIPIAQIISLG